MGAARCLVFAVLLVAAGAHPGHAATEQLTRFFAFGPGTANALATSDSVGLVVPSRTVVRARVTFDSGCCNNLRVTFIDPTGAIVFDSEGRSFASPLDLGATQALQGCPRSWLVRVRTTNAFVPLRGKVSGAVVFDFDPPGEEPALSLLTVKLRDGKISLDARSTSSNRVLTGCDNAGSIHPCDTGFLTEDEGSFFFEAKWHSDPTATFNDFRQLTVSLVSPDGTAVRSATGFSKHAPADKTPKLSFVYAKSAADALQTGTWKLRVANNSPVRIVDFNIESSFDSLLDTGMPSFDSDYVRICNDPTGGFGLVPSEATVRRHDTQNYEFTWIVPDGGSWHDLNDLQLRIRDDEDTVLWLRFNEADRRFSLQDRGARKFGHAFPAGSHKKLSTPFVTLDLSRSSVGTSGPTDPRVTLDLALRFKSKAAGRTFIVEVAATDKDGNDTGFLPAGSLVVSGK